MKCKEMKKIFVKYTKTGRQPGAKALAHINACAACAKEYAALKKISAAIDSVAQTKNIMIPADYNKTVWEKLGVETPAFSFEKFIAAFKRPVFAGAAMALACFVVVIFAVKQNAYKQDGYAAAPASAQKSAGEQESAHREHAVKKAQEVKSYAKENAGKADNIKQPVPAAIVQAPCVKNSNEQQAKTFAASPGTQAGAGPGKNLEAAAVAASNLKEEIKTTPTITDPVYRDGAKLENNKINPYKNEQIVIKYSLSKNSQAKVEVYSRNGEQVKQISSGTKAPGHYEEKWGGEDKAGRTVSSGIYIIYVKTGNTEHKLKACVVK